LFRYDEAHDVLREGLDTADEALDHAAAGDIHQRIFTVWWVTPNYFRALNETHLAMTRYVEAGCEVGIGKVLVDRGNAFLTLDKREWSDECFHTALGRLPESVGSHRAAAWQGLGINRVARGDHKGALQMLREAEQIPLDPMNRSKVKWLSGQVLAQAGRFPLAIERLEEAAEALLQLAPNNGALCVIDLAATYLKAGDQPSSHRAVRMLQEILPSIERKAALMAAAELVNLGLAGKGLTLALLKKAKGRGSRFY
jgi:tetratricopeptide (TPR) repeat protein